MFEVYVHSIISLFFGRYVFKKQQNYAICVFEKFTAAFYFITLVKPCFQNKTKDSISMFEKN